MKNTWSVVETRFNPALGRAYEGLFTQGSELLHVRGSLEEHLYDAPQNVDYTRRPANVTIEEFSAQKAKWGTYNPGIRGNHPLLNRGIANLPWFLGLIPSLDDEKLDMETSDIRNYQRSLCLKTAVLRRSFVWVTRNGAKLQVVFERFISAAHPGLCVQRLQVNPDQDVSIEIKSSLDSDVRTSGYDIFTNTDLERIGKDGIRCHITTNTGDQVWISSHVLATDANWCSSIQGRTATLTDTFRLPAGSLWTIEKRTAVTSSFNLVGLDPEEILGQVDEISYDQIIEAHTRVWQKRWEKSDVLIEGDVTSQLALRISLYHLLRANPDDPRLAIDPKAFSGDAYRGCFFWDTEMYLLPFFLYTDPERARTLVDYRIHSLSGARQNAATTNYFGARYAWEADIDGSETCPNWQYRDHEVHVTADVVYGLAHYAQVTQNETFLSEHAGEVILETARYWLDRVDWRTGEDTPSLLGVMGPDEYTPISNNNAYTNRMAAFNLRLASRLGERIGSPPDEYQQFTRVADGLPILRSADRKLIIQCEEFEHLAEPDFDRFWVDRSRPAGSQMTQERLYRSKCLKQADVLMLMMLFPDEFSDQEVQAAWDYYLPYTTHDSSLSAGTHAIVACRLKNDQSAWEFWERSSLNDLDFENGGAAEGVHIAGAGINWQIAIFGFAGLSSAMNSEVLCLHPRLPKKWVRMSFPVVWKGQAATIEIATNRIEITNLSTQPLPILIRDQKVILPAGERFITL